MQRKSQVETHISTRKSHWHRSAVENSL